MRKSLFALAGALALPACAAGPDFTPPPAPATQSYAMEADDPTSAVIALGAPMDAGGWWRAFRSPTLDAVMRQALANNQTLAQADATLAAARAEAAAASGALAPEIDASAGAVRERINTSTFGIAGLPSPTLTLYSIGPSVRFDLDPFGGRRRAAESAAANAEAAQRRAEAAYLSLTGRVAAQAFRIASLRGQLAAIDALVADDRRTLDIVQRAIQFGGQPAAAADTANAQLAEDLALIPPLRQDLAEARHALAALVGAAPVEWAAPNFDLADFTVPTSIPAALPSALVRRRPDIMAAEAALHAATADIGVAEAARYPNIALNASLLQSATDADALFRYQASGWSVGPAITAPLFHGGALRANQRAAEARANAALAAYRQTVIAAFVQVADVMSAVGHDSDLLAAQQRALDAAERNARSADLGFENGAQTLLATIDARRQAHRARRGAIAAQGDLYTDISALFVATAADWRDGLRGPTQP